MDLLSKKSNDYDQIRGEIERSLKLINRDPGKYPGGQPIHLTKGDVLDVLRKKSGGNYKYAVNLKADGVRYIMFGGPLVDAHGKTESSSIQDKAYRRPYFVNRRFDIYQLKNKKVIIPSRSPFILDGEILEFDGKKKRKFHMTATQAKHIAFSVFDALLTPTTNLNTSSRWRWDAAEAFVDMVNKGGLKKAAEVGAFRTKATRAKQPVRYIGGRRPQVGLTAKDATWSSSPESRGSTKAARAYTQQKNFTMLMTKHLDISVLGEAPANSINGDDAYKFLVKKLEKSYTTAGYTVPFDGLVFTPWDMPYVCGPWMSCANVCYKWKPQFQSTIDLVVKYEPSEKGLWFATKSQGDVNKVVNKKMQVLVDPKRVQKLPPPSIVPHDTVVELRYFPESGNFEFTQARHDKSRDLANAYKTVQNVLRQHFQLEVVAKFIKNPQANWKGAIEYTPTSTLAEMARTMNTASASLVDKVKRLCKGKDSFVHIDYPTVAFEDALKCLGVLYPWKESMFVRTDQGDYMAVGLSGRTWVKYGGKTLKEGSALEFEGTKITRRKQGVHKGPSGTALTEADKDTLQKGTQRVLRYTFLTHFGNVVFEKSFKGRKSEPKTKIYSELKTMKNAEATLKLIKEFNFFLSKRQKDRIKK